MKNFWHMQLHPNDKHWGKEVKLLKSKALIGLGIWDDKKSQIPDFKKKMDIGDIVVVRNGSKPLALVKVVSKPYYKKITNNDLDWFENRRKVEVLDFYKNEYNFHMPASRGTLMVCNDLNTQTSKNIINWYKEILKKQQMKEYITLLEKNKNLIFTGSPGTGKTYLAKEIAKHLIGTETKSPSDILEVAIKNFKPDKKQREKLESLLKKFYSLFPKNKIKNLTLDEYCVGTGRRDNFCWWIETGLKELGYYFPGSARSYLIYWNKKEEKYYKHGYLKSIENIEEALRILLSDISKMINNKSIESIKDKLGNSLMLKILNTYYPNDFFPINSLTHIDNIIKLFDIHIDKNANILDKNKALNNFYKQNVQGKDLTPYEFCNILYKNFNIKEGEIKDNSGNIKLSGEMEFVQFHPSYDYTDFVEGLRPIKKEGQNDLGFELRNGIFKNFCKHAKDNPNKKFVFIIDEINRAEISKVFGELFFAIDIGYRGEEGKVKTQYANMQTEETFFTDKYDDYFFVPSNVYIIGTMNDIDRSVESFDFAMRRRFAWKEIKAIDRIEMLYEELEPELAKKSETKMIALNKEIENTDGLSSSYHIGPAYFLNLKKKKYDGDFDKLWENHLEVLLREYLRGMHDAKNKLTKLHNAYENKEE